MKRSEFATKLRDLLYMRPMDHAKFEYQILDTVESLGMRPPFSSEQFMKQKK